MQLIRSGQSTGIIFQSSRHDQTAPDENICPDCADETKLVESGYDDDLEYYEVYACLGDCGGHFDQVGEPIYDGSDYNDRMSERRQMGFLMS